MAQRYPGDSVGAVPPAAGLDRRRFLRMGAALGAGAGLAAVLGSAGCSLSDPRIEPPAGQAGGGPNGPGGATPQPPPPRPTFAGAAEGAESERRLAGLAVATITGWHKELGDRAELLVAIRDGHLAHATALLGAEPTTRPTDHPTTAIKPHATAKSATAALKRLVAAEHTAAARRRTAALATTGLGSLLWASMSVAAGSYATALSDTAAVQLRKPRAPQPMPVLSDVEAMQRLVEQLHAANFGYPMAIGQLADGGRRNAAIRQLRHRRDLRDALVGRLQARKAEIPIAEPAYVPSVYPRTNATAGQLVQDMESRLAPFVGLWLAAVSTAPDRTRAFDELSTTVANALRWGSPLPRWPGWIA